MAGGAKKRPRLRCSRWSVATAMLPLHPTMAAVEHGWSSAPEALLLHRPAWMMGRGGGFSRGDDEASQHHRAAAQYSGNNPDPTNGKDDLTWGNQDVDSMDTVKGDVAGGIFNKSSASLTVLLADESSLLGDFEKEVQRSLEYRSELHETFNRWKRKLAQSTAKLKHPGPTVAVESHLLSKPMLDSGEFETHELGFEVNRDIPECILANPSLASPPKHHNLVDESTERTQTNTVRRRARIETELEERRQLLMDLLSSYQQQGTATSPNSSASSNTTAQTNQSIEESSEPINRHDVVVTPRVSTFRLQGKGTGNTKKKPSRKTASSASIPRVSETATPKPLTRQTATRQSTTLPHSDEPGKTIEVMPLATMTQPSRRNRTRNNALLMASTHDVTSIDRRIWNTDLKGGETNPHVALMLQPTTILSPDDIRALRPHVRMLAIALLYILATSIAYRLLTWALGIHR